MAPIFDGPMREWLESTVANKNPGQVKLFVWEDGRPFTVRNFYGKWHAACGRLASKNSFLTTLADRRVETCKMTVCHVHCERRSSGTGQMPWDERYGVADLEDAKVLPVSTSS